MLIFTKASVYYRGVSIDEFSLGEFQTFKILTLLLYLTRRAVFAYGEP